MKKDKKLTPRETRLIRRYLLWCYKTTREALDRIDRYFTQLKVDHFVLAELSRLPELKDKTLSVEYTKKIDEFQNYIEEKGEQAFPQKFSDINRERIHPEYWYLQSRLSAVEKAIVYFLGASDLKNIEAIYEEEMTRRILEAREHT